MVTRRTIQTAVGYFVALLLLALGAVWASRNWDSLVRAASLDWRLLLPLLPLVVVANTFTGLINQVMATHLGAPLPLREVIPLGLASTAANYFLPMRAGAGLRAAYFKKRCNLPLTAFAGSMAAVYVITLLVNATLGLGGMALVYANQQVWSTSVAVVFASVVAICLAALLVRLPAIGKDSPNRILVKLWRVHTGWETLRRSPGVLARSAGLSVLLTSTLMVRLFLIYLALGQPVSWAGCMLIAAMTAVSTFVSITPAGLGVREAMILFASIAIGVTPEVSLVAATIDRVAAVVVLAIAGPISMVYLSRRVNADLRHPDALSDS
ncbi:MAG: YbhN family protein [Phycisphaerae bacterium]